MENASLYKEEFLKDVLELPCPSCGSELSYSAKTQDINCGHCGYSKPLDQANDLVQEQCLDKAIKETACFEPHCLNKKIIDCNGCGAQLMIDETDVAVRCNFCGSEKVNETAIQKNLIQPQGVIPFQIDKEAATQKFREWIQKGWFKPNKLQRLAELGDVHGIYVPFWTYDAMTYTRWSGEAGHHYYETETYNDIEGKSQTREVKKTRWTRHSGDFEQFFDDILIVASKGMPHKIIRSIYPFQLGKAINYTNDLMVGWEAEIYSLNVEEGYKVADKQMDQELYAKASHALGGDEQRFLSVDSQKWNQTFKHIILPVWMCSYLYNDKTYYFAVNGQTGKINGTKPTSWFKVTALLIVIIAIIAGIIYAVNQN